MNSSLLLREGLMADLGFGSITDLAKGVGFPDILTLTEAFNRESEPSSSLLSALCGAFPVVPLMYFVEVRA